MHHEIFNQTQHPNGTVLSNCEKLTAEFNYLLPSRSVKSHEEECAWLKNISLKLTRISSQKKEYAFILIGHRYICVLFGAPIIQP